VVDEKVYRLMLKSIYESIERGFEKVDPDEAEVEVSQGSCTILAKGKKIIVSPQPPVRQVWLAAANLGTAVHFSFDPATELWLDDKGQGRELFSSIEEVVAATLGRKITLPRPV
jgi:iron donor protein CyaY